MDAPNVPPPQLVDDAGEHGNRPPGPEAEPELVTVNASGKPANARKRKARDDGQPAQPRRLTRSHEACARCRRKKSKCDSKHPSCSACLAAGVECVQEDRYRQTLKPRGYTDLLEAQIDKCAALLNKFIPGFKLEYLDYHLSNYGVALHPSEGQSSQFIPAGYVGGEVVGPEHLQGTLGYDPATGQYPVGPTAYPQPRPEGFPLDPNASMDAADQSAILNTSAGPSGSGFVNRGLYNQETPKSDAKGGDPMYNDVSTTPGLVKAFGVSQKIAKGLKPDEPVSEDILGGVPPSAGPAKPKNAAAWLETPIPLAASEGSQAFVLPRDRDVLDNVLTVYFTELNTYRPIFDEVELREKIDVLYATVAPEAELRQTVASSKYPDIAEDAGFLASVYLALALGSLCVENRRRHEAKQVEENWPSPEEFYDYALALKPYLRNTLPTLQALLALHWYLYVEHRGQGLWRLVGSTVRLGVELGLHHDPREQDIFTPEEIQLRMRLWAICLMHDRDTSIIHGRPLAIQRADFNTPPPSRFVPNPAGGDAITTFAEHFELASELLHIQGDVVNSLYRPGKLTGEQVVLRAIEIERSLEQWRRKLPASYQKLFGGSMSLDRPQRVDLVLNLVNVDRGITMLKYGILRLFLLRSVFNNKLVSAHVRHKALHDAVIMSHNVLVIHAQLTSYPEVAFFVSPTPIHVAAMIILFASISKVETLAWGLAREDVALSLKVLPLFRWRWDSEDLHTGSHQLVSQMAAKVYGASEADSAAPSPPMLIDEMYWLSDAILRSDWPPRIEDVWNEPQAGAPEARPLPVGLGGDHHEQKLTLGADATLREQQAQFAAAVEKPVIPRADAAAAAAEGSGSTQGSSMDVDDRDASDVQALVDELGGHEQEPPTRREGDPEYLDSWTKRDAT